MSGGLFNYRQYSMRDTRLYVSNKKWYMKIIGLLKSMIVIYTITAKPCYHRVCNKKNGIISDISSSAAWPCAVS